MSTYTEETIFVPSFYTRKIVFNHEIFLDLEYLEPRPYTPILYVVDRGTHFSAARFAPDESAERIWNTFLSCWVSVYFGFPNIVSHDQGSLFSCDFFSSTCVKFGIIQKSTLTEFHNSSEAVERYHASLRKIYKNIRLEYPDLDKKVALSVANYGLNVTVNSEGLIPIILVFGSIPKIPLADVQYLPLNQREQFKQWNLLDRKWNELSPLSVSK